MIFFHFNREDDNASWVIQSPKKLDTLTISKIDFYVESNPDELLDGRTVDTRGNNGGMDIRRSKILWLGEEKKIRLFVQRND